MTGAFAGDHIIKYDASPAAFGLDTGVLAVRDIVMGVGARVFLACVGDRVLECRGCMDGESRVDSLIIAARNASHSPWSRNVFKATSAEIEAQEKEWAAEGPGK